MAKEGLHDLNAQGNVLPSMQPEEVHLMQLADNLHQNIPMLPLPQKVDGDILGLHDNQLVENVPPIYLRTF